MGYVVERMTSPQLMWVKFRTVRKKGYFSVWLVQGVKSGKSKEEIL